MSTATTIQQYYNAFYGRPADPSGLRFWVNGVEQSGNLIGSAIRIFGDPSTPEFALRFPAGTSIGTFLDTAYGNMFNRTPDAEGKAFWTAAFDNWVGGGLSEGEARALILKNFIDAANGQVGTKDKLTITNKLVVADAMTDSVRAYGTELGYMSNLTKAQNLLAGVDYSQASVNTALARITSGYVDGTDPLTGAPAAQVSIINAGDYNSELLLDKSKKEIIKFEISGDAPFTYAKYSDGTTGPGGFVIMNFETARDRIDLSTFNLDLNGGTSVDMIREPAWSGIVWHDWAGANPDGSPVGYKNYPDFFNGKVIVAWETSPGTSYNSIDVFIDINQSGSLEPETDLWLTFSRVSAQQMNESLFIL